MINSESYLPQAITWIDEVVGSSFNFNTDDSLFNKAMLADSLVQLEIAKQLGCIANSLDQLVRAQRR